MLMKFILVFILFSSILPVFAHDQEVVIGCTKKCDFFYRRGLKKAARHHGLTVKILDLSISEKVNWNELDGVVVPGGADINPEYYLSQVEPSLREYTKMLDRFVKYTLEGKKRDPFEFSLLKEYFSNEKLKDFPILGVCRGMQMLAVSQGIPLYVDIKHEFGIRNRRYLFDRVYVENSDSVMNEIFGSSFLGFKRHHQGVRVWYFNKYKDRWPNIEITSYSNNGIIAVSLEFKDRPVLGVQFHPENDFGYERKGIFGWLISKALERRLNNN